MKRGVLIILFILIIPFIKAFCGDGLIDKDGFENCGTCPEDNPCYVDSKCINDECISRLIPPILLKEDASATVIIPKSIAVSLNYKFNQETEFVACLKGKYSDGVYQITKLTNPEVLENSPYHIEHTGCPKIGTVATIHSHLSGNCDPSDADLFSFGRKKEPLLGIICGENHFGFYSRANLENIKTRMNYLIRDIPQSQNNYFIFYLPWIFSSTLIIVLAIVFYKKHKIIFKKK